MSNKGSALIWVAVAVIALLLLGVGGFFGYRAWIDARQKTAVETAAAYEEATLTGDASGLADVLPAELVSAMSDSDLKALAGGEWVFDATEWDGDELHASYTRESTDGQTVELEVTYALSSDFSARSTTVKSESTLSAEYIEDPTRESARTELVWLDGAWRVAGYQWKGDNEFDYTYYRDGKSAKSVLDALRTALGLESDPGDAGSSDSTSGDAKGIDGAVKVVADFHEALVRGDYNSAYPLLPEDKRIAYGGAAAFAEQVGAYGITGYKILESRMDADGAAVIRSSIVTANGDFGYEWHLELQGGSWVAVSRETTGMDDSTSGSAPLTPEQLENGELPSGHPELGGS